MTSPIYNRHLSVLEVSTSFYLGTQVTKPLSPRQRTWLNFRLAAARDPQFDPCKRVELISRLSRELMTQEQLSVMGDTMLRTFEELDPELRSSDTLAVG